MADFADSLIPHLGWLTHPPGDEVAHFLAEGWFEYREQAFCWMYLGEGDTVIDAGAHFGLYASLAARLTGPTGRVLAVEANPRIEPYLSQNLARHGENRTRLLLAALGGREGEANFFVGGAGRDAYSGSVAETPGAEPCKVRVVTIDDVCGQETIARVAFAKLDVEGDEIEALRGARVSIAKGVLPLWMIEFAEASQQRRGSSTRALFEEIVSLGYTVCRFDELRCRLVPLEWTEPVWYENYFATAALDQVNQRLSECSAERAQVARDILRRGAAAMALREAAGKAGRLQAEAETRAAALETRGAALETRGAGLEERLREAGDQAAKVAESIALEKDKFAQQASMEKHEAAQQLEAARQAADEAGRRAEEINRHLEESWRRIGEANWRADQAVNRAETAAERSESAYRRLEVADRRAANARYQAGLLKTRLRELLSHPRLARAPKPEWAESLLAFGDGFAPPGLESDSGDPMLRALYHLAGKNFRPRAVLDAGAGKGYWSVNAQSFFPDAAYFMIDPLQENEEDLRRICEQNQQFHFLSTALGDVDGMADIYVTPDLFGSSCLPLGDGQAARPVEQRTVDGLLREGCIAQPDLVKIDVQGYEFKVLNGAENALKNVEVLIVEVNLFRFMPGYAMAHEVIGFLAERGFVLFDLAGSLRRPFEDDLAQIDLLFVSAQSDLVKSARWA